MENNRVEINLLGGFEIRVDGKPVLAPLYKSRKATHLVQYLLLHYGERVLHRELLEAIWGTTDADDPGKADMALRAILHRLRTMVDAENLDVLDRCVITSRGGYNWNTSLPCTIDLCVMEELIARSREEGLSEEERVALDHRILDMYVGKLLPGSAGEAWVEKRSIELQNGYEAALFDLLNVYRTRGNYEEIERLLNRAMAIDPYSEPLYIEMIYALKKQNKDHHAKEVEKAARVRGCLRNTIHADAVEGYYEAHRTVERTAVDSVGIIAADIMNDDGESCYVCEYESFRDIYRVQHRIAGRYGVPMLMAVVTLIPPQEGLSNRKVQTKMQLLQNVMMKTLRSSDVIAQYSGNQFVVLLNYNGAQDGNTPLERIKADFYRHNKNGGYGVSYRLCAPELVLKK